MKTTVTALVVDDELDICLMVTKYLQSLHFETHYAITIKDARSIVKSETFDLMFVDLTLPDGSGFEIIRQAHELKQAQKIIVMSANDNQADEAYALGASLFINKPFTIKTIQEALQSLQFLTPNITSHTGTILV
jgi:DNA-binding response OmpR family regulator